MHTASKRVIEILIKEGIKTLVIGKNDGWKQEANMGKQNNQNFCQIVRLVQPKSVEGRMAGKA